MDNEGPPVIGDQQSYGGSQREEQPPLHPLLTKQPLRCDFCGGSHVKWLYPTKNTARTPMVMDVEPTDVGGDWLACDKCFEYVENGMLKELTDYAFQMFVESLAWRRLEQVSTDDQMETSASMIREQMRLAHESFVANKLKGPRPI